VEQYARSACSRSAAGEAEQAIAAVVTVDRHIRARRRRRPRSRSVLDVRRRLLQRSRGHDAPMRPRSSADFPQAEQQFRSLSRSSTTRTWAAGSWTACPVAGFLDLSAASAPPPPPVSGDQGRGRARTPPSPMAAHPQDPSRGPTADRIFSSDDSGVAARSPSNRTFRGARPARGQTAIMTSSRSSSTSGSRDQQPSIASHRFTTPTPGGAGLNAGRRR
jgi:hypothetical protein